MTLKQLIAARGLSGTPDEIAQALNAKTEFIIDSTQYTWAYLALKFGPEKCIQWHSALTAAGLGWVTDQLSGAGIDFSHETTIAMIEQLAATGLLTAEDAAALKAIGRTPVSPYELAFGVGAVVTPDEVAAALATPDTPVKTIMINALSRNAQPVINIQILRTDYTGSQLLKSVFYQEGIAREYTNAEQRIIDMLVGILTEIGTWEV